MAGVFVTAFYSFRMLFLAFHGTERFDQAVPRRRTTTRGRTSTGMPGPARVAVGRHLAAGRCWRSRRS